MWLDILCQNYRPIVDVHRRRLLPWKLIAFEIVYVCQIVYNETTSECVFDIHFMPESFIPSARPAISLGREAYCIVYIIGV